MSLAGVSRLGYLPAHTRFPLALIAVGVPAELHAVPGAYHAYDLLVPKAAVTARFTEYWTTALRRALASS